MNKKIKNLKPQNHTSDFTPHTSCNHRGITLLALIITIIIMLILAGVTIGTINGGLFNYAGKAKQSTEVANEKDIVSNAAILAMSNNKYGKITKDELQKELEKIVGKDKTDVTTDEDSFIEIFSDSNRKYFIDSKGNTRIVEWWKDIDKQGKSVITNGNIKLGIGDYINYDATDNGEITETYTSSESKNGVSDQIFDVGANSSGWRVLGVKHLGTGDKIVLLSAQPIFNNSGEGFSLNYLGYKYAVTELNDICEIYGKSRNAESAKSITVEDINKITGYSPLKTETGVIYRKDEMNEYMNKITVYREAFSKFNFEGSNRL